MNGPHTHERHDTTDWLEERNLPLPRLLAGRCEQCGAVLTYTSSPQQPERSSSQHCGNTYTVVATHGVLHVQRPRTRLSATEDR